MTTSFKSFVTEASSGPFAVYARNEDHWSPYARSRRDDNHDFSDFFNNIKLCKTEAEVKKYLLEMAQKEADYWEAELDHTTQHNPHLSDLKKKSVDELIEALQSNGWDVFYKAA